VSELMYIVTTRDLFNSKEYCAPRPISSKTFKVTDDSNQVLFGVSDSFVQETARMLCELRVAIFRYKMYPRLLVECTSYHTNLRERQISFPDIATLKLPIGESLYCEHGYISQFFFAQPEDEAIVSKRWKRWVDNHLRDYYHDRSKITLHKTGLVQALRPGEHARSSASNQGVPPGFYEILKKNRPMGTLDNLDFHAFNIPKDQLMAYCSDLTRKTHRIRDAALLYLLDQYMYHTFNIRFAACFVKQEHELAQGFDDLERSDHPILIQTLGGFDVYCTGEVTQTRNLGRAFLIWCYKIASRFMGMVYRAISIQSMLKELLFDDEKEKNETIPMQTEAAAVASYWI
jgi:hypothetical protein